MLQECYEHAWYLLHTLTEIPLSRSTIGNACLGTLLKSDAELPNRTGNWLGLGLSVLKVNGYADNPVRGRWKLTPTGVQAKSVYGDKERFKEHVAVNFRHHMKQKRKKK